MRQAAARHAFMSMSFTRGHKLYLFYTVVRSASLGRLADIHRCHLCMLPAPSCPATLSYFITADSPRGALGAGNAGVGGSGPDEPRRLDVAGGEHGGHGRRGCHCAAAHGSLVLPGVNSGATASPMVSAVLLAQGRASADTRSSGVRQRNCRRGRSCLELGARADGCRKTQGPRSSRTAVLA